MLKRLVIGTALLGSLSLGSKKPREFHVPDQTVRTDFGDFSITELVETGQMSSRRLAGSIVNNTKKIWYKPIFAFHFESLSGVPITCTQCQVTLGGLFGPGQRVAFGSEPTSEPFGIFVSALMGSNHRLLSVALGSPSFYSADYEFSLVDPPNGKNLRFEDANLSFAFLPGYKGIQVTIRNKTAQEATLDWNGAAMIGVGGDPMPVVHQGLKYTNSAAVKPPSVIPPSGTFEDTVTPVSSLRFDNQAWGPGNWLPFAPVANTYRGETFGVVLPVSAAGNLKKYVFRFHIDDVR